MSEGLAQAVRRLDERVVRDADVRASHWYGPPPEDDCPCGSHREATRCHRANDGSWIAEPPPPLLTGPRTGYANPGCYARASKDCDEELTREHFITDDVLGAISADGKVVVVEGAAWQDKTERRKTIGRASLSRKMLCRRHNNALSPLDQMAAEFFRYFLEDHHRHAAITYTTPRDAPLFGRLGGPGVNVTHRSSVGRFCDVAKELSRLLLRPTRCG
ncbi:hypothetical protein [Mycobacterium avium]|uniref:hypothetical protein n=1 Tax=Mycobacterium avium TaxID=1764 RepID=UPI001CC3A6E0|nr:hypothetical protein [Mycobacterium avium]MBZ4518191.1 hypothetical protein [Mycobacterium avium subsp. hominissuis]MBZ4566549.1 hypothetical protein [Mycobacterium avium subsp. hominissuis]MBZ4632745.1 hypothetical protein [Mycobacterium avium subsp. hominissuis]